MKNVIFILLSVFVSFSFNRQDDQGFTQEEMLRANTAKDVTYLSQVERDVIYMINLCRINPGKFLRNNIESSQYIKENIFFIKKSPKYLSSLKQKLKTMKALQTLVPDKDLYETALCLAKQQEKSGETGHERKKCKKDYYGECCSYGMSTAEGIVMQLLVDLNVSSLGHREILLGNYTKIGVAAKGHKQYGNCAVLDFQ